MAKARGKLAYIQVDVGSSVFKDLINVTDMTISQSTDEIDSSDADTSGWKEYIVGDRQATIDVTVNFTGAATQEIIHDAWLNNTTFAIKYGFRKYTSAFATTVKVNTCTIDCPANGIRTLKATLRIMSIPTTTTATVNADTAGVYTKQRGKYAGLLFEQAGVTVAGTAASKVLTLTGGAGTNYAVGSQLMVESDNKIYTIASVASTTITLVENLGTSPSGKKLYTEFENMTALTFNGSQDEIESTDADTQGFKEYLAGDAGMTIDTTCNYSEATNQAAVIAAFYAATSLTARWFYGVNSTKKWFTAPLLINKDDVSSAQASVQTMSFTFRVQTKPTATTQA